MHWYCVTAILMSNGLIANSVWHRVTTLLVGTPSKDNPTVLEYSTVAN